MDQRCFVSLNRTTFCCCSLIRLKLRYLSALIVRAVRYFLAWLAVKPGPASFLLPLISIRFQFNKLDFINEIRNWKSFYGKEKFIRRDKGYITYNQDGCQTWESGSNGSPAIWLEESRVLSSSPEHFFMPQGQKVPLLLTYVAGSNTCVQPNPLTGALSLTCVQHHGVLQDHRKVNNPRFNKKLLTGLGRYMTDVAFNYGAECSTGTLKRK